ncbi:MAG: ANTAR domain-containing protein [Maledivibacter sp.]|nr:ANTAR domain-containing protein [Maledivibacter sp.]
MNKYNILVADSSETSRKKICNLLIKKGYKIFQATDGAGAIRMCRSVFPNLVIMDMNLWGMSAYEVAHIIEDNKLSNVIFITNSPNKAFYEKLREMNIFAYIMKPINPDQFYQMIEFSIMNSNKINSLKKKVEKLEETLESRKKLDRAKGILMKQFNVNEDEAYKMLRKKSMDTCRAMSETAKEIIDNYKLSKLHNYFL